MNYLKMSKFLFWTGFIIGVGTCGSDSIGTISNIEVFRNLIIAFSLMGLSNLVEKKGEMRNESTSK